MKILRYKEDKKSIESGKLLKWSIEILEGIAFLHSKTIIHRDIKPA